MKRYLILFLMCVLSMEGVNAQEPLLIKLAENGDENVQLYLADAYFYGKDGIKKNVKESRRWYEEAAKQGNKKAIYELALFNWYLNGERFNNSEEITQALQRLTPIADGGYAPAQWFISTIFHSHNMFEECFKYSKAASEQSYIPAYLMLAECYKSPTRLRNLDEAIKYYKKSIDEGGYNYGYIGLADCYLFKGEFALAVDFYKKSINVDKEKAYFCLANLYARGQGVKQDYHEAHRFIDVIITINPNDPNYYACKGQFYLMEGQKSKAKEMWDKVVLLDPKALERTDSLALVMINSVDSNIPETDIKTETTLAIIIANQNYKRVSSVPFANNDGKVFSEYCKKTLGIHKSHIFCVEDATLGDMKYHINLVKKIADTYKGEARLIFYYAGHGIPDENDKSAYLLPVDGYANDITSGFSLKELYSELENIHAKSVIVILDACFSGTKRDGDMLVSARGVAIKPKQDSPKGNMLVMSAAQGEETAYPYNEKGHGLFTYYLLKKIQETKGNVTLGELADYLISEVRKQSVLVNKKMQTPIASPSANATDWRNWKLR